MQFHSALRRSALEADRDEYKRLYEKCLGEKRWQSQLAMDVPCRLVVKSSSMGPTQPRYSQRYSQRCRHRLSRDVTRADQSMGTARWTGRIRQNPQNWQKLQVLGCSRASHGRTWGYARYSRRSGALHCIAYFFLSFLLLFLLKFMALLCSFYFLVASIRPVISVRILDKSGKVKDIICLTGSALPSTRGSRQKGYKCGADLIAQSRLASENPGH